MPPHTSFWIRRGAVGVVARRRRPQQQQQQQQQHGLARRMTTTVSALGSLRGPPVSAVVPPGHCQFGPEGFMPATLLEKCVVSPSSSLLRFSLPDPTKPLGLATCACLLLRSPDGDVRPYTPISTNALVGSLDLLVKNYPSTGTVSRYLCEELPVGSSAVGFQHVPFNVKIPADTLLSKDRIIMVAGGSGITPMIQALHALLGASGSGPSITLLYGNRDAGDILARTLLDGWAHTHGDCLEVVHVLSSSSSSSEPGARHGRIGRAILEEFLPPTPDPGTLVLVCGPPPMYESLCGPRDDPGTVAGVLGELGYGPSQVYKF